MPKPAAIFNADEEEDEREAEKQARKKKKLEKIDYGEHALEEDKKRAAEMAKSIIDMIPTDTDALFAYPLKWQVLDDNDVADEKMKPWVQKKLIEYLGEEEPTLTAYITTLIKQHKGPKDILEEVIGILDNDAQIFVVKLWRMLLFEVLKAELG